MTFYFSGTAAYCIFLICKMFQDRECSKTDSYSWIVIAIASLLWIVVIPISIMELQAKAKKRAKNNLQNIKAPVTDY